MNKEYCAGKFICLNQQHVVIRHDVAGLCPLCAALKERQQLLAVLRKLVAEVDGLISVAEPELRMLAGNTNFAVLSLRFVDALALLREIDGEPEADKAIS